MSCAAQSMWDRSLIHSTYVLRALLRIVQTSSWHVWSCKRDKLDSVPSCVTSLFPEKPSSCWLHTLIFNHSVPWERSVCVCAFAWPWTVKFNFFFLNGCKMISIWHCSTCTVKFTVSFLFSLKPGATWSSALLKGFLKKQICKVYFPVNVGFWNK